MLLLLTISVFFKTVLAKKRRKKLTTMPLVPAVPGRPSAPGGPWRIDIKGKRNFRQCEMGTLDLFQKQCSVSSNVSHIDSLNPRSVRSQFGPVCVLALAAVLSSCWYRIRTYRWTLYTVRTNRTSRSLKEEKMTRSHSRSVCCSIYGWQLQICARFQYGSWCITIWFGRSLEVHDVFQLKPHNQQNYQRQ